MEDKGYKAFIVSPDGIIAEPIELLHPLPPDIFRIKNPTERMATNLKSFTTTICMGRKEFTELQLFFRRIMASKQKHKAIAMIKRLNNFTKYKPKDNGTT